MRHSNLKGTLILLAAAIIWGFAFVAQSNAADIPPMLVNCLRSAISVVFLSGLFLVLNRKDKKPFFPKLIHERRMMIRGGVICGACFTVATNLQQAGISMYPKSAPIEAHSGFLTALYVVIVPILSLVLRKKFSPIIWGGVILALGGFYMLCLYEGVGSFYFADLIVLFCAVAYSMQIMAIDAYVDSVGGVKLSLMQFAFCAVVSGVLSAIFEYDKIVWAEVLNSALLILYLGIMSSGIAYTLQMIGQKYAEASVASITMSLESVFAAIGGWLISGKSLKTSELIGCVLVFAAIIITQIPDFLKKKPRDCDR